MHHYPFTKSAIIFHMVHIHCIIFTLTLSSSKTSNFTCMYMLFFPFLLFPIYISPIVGILFGAHPRNAMDPVGDVRQFVSQFEAEYGTDHPPFLCCSYGDVSCIECLVY